MKFVAGFFHSIHSSSPSDFPFFVVIITIILIIIIFTRPSSRRDQIGQRKKRRGMEIVRLNKECQDQIARPMENRRPELANEKLVPQTLMSL